MPVLVRPAGPRDAAGMAEVHVASWRTTYPGLLPDEILLSLSPHAYAARWRAMLADPLGARGCWVVEEEPHGIVGFGWCGPQRLKIEGFAGEFYAIYLLDHAQGRGSGRLLMAAMAEDLMERGYTSALVWVLRENPARWFYERLGGQRLAEHPIAYGGRDLTESAYGWRDLAPLARLSAGSSLR